MTYLESFERDQKEFTESDKKKREEEIKSKLSKAQIKFEDEIKPPPPVIQLDNYGLEPITIFTEGNLSVIQGKAKVRKSFAVAMLAACAVSDSVIYRKFIPAIKRRVFYFDTEQSSFYVQQAYHRIIQMANGEGYKKRLFVFCLRPYTPAERIELIDYVFENVKDLGFVIIDGIRDLVSNINDPDESTMITSKLLKWSEESNAHILTVLHENKADGKLRGHIGTELSNKAETVLKVEMLADDIAVSKISCEMVRGIQFEPVYFKIIDNIPEVISGYVENTGGFV